ncbi:MAG: molecular chaperone TorD family protein [Alphaproteobacteria bacterium]|nr:molecular chaperone TorD family protein [Alphaproteobacteria bacterium]
MPSTLDQAASAEELARQALYALLTRVLAKPMTQAEAQSLTPFLGSDSNFGQAATALRDALTAADAASLGEEYHNLFIGVGRGELLPFASYYLTGFLNEKPLAQLRRDMAQLGFERPAGVKEPEDHIAAICDIMSHLIEGTALGEFDIYDQDKFFAAHLRPWAGKFFADLESAKTADVYRHVGRVGKLFMEIEEQGFGMIARA